MASEVTCPGCGGSLQLLPANTRATDLRCKQCGETYQLKSQSRPFGHRILGAEYNTTLKSIQNDTHPSLILLYYDPNSMLVKGLEFVHKSWITPSAIIARKPLGPNARRAGWQGCQINFDRIPALARIQAIKEGTSLPSEQVRAQWLKAQSIAGVTAESRGWTSDVLWRVDALPVEFTLHDIYRFEVDLAKLHPSNHNIRAKIRQQLQVARDLHVIEFVGRGRYRKTDITNPGAA